MSFGAGEVSFAGDRAILRARSTPDDPGMDNPTMETQPKTAPGTLRLRPALDGLPDPNIAPPVVAETGDPFATVRILHLLARIERGRPARLDDLVNQLNATYLDWLFTPSVVADAVLQLQANWMADYRNGSGIILEEDADGVTITIEDSSRVDPWFVRQVERAADACRERLLEFSRRDHVTSDR